MNCPRPVGNTVIVRVIWLLFAGLAATSNVEARAAEEPLKVYILVGQSNMQGHAQVRTFEHIGMDPHTAPMLQEMRDADGSSRVCEHVWISSVGSADEERFGRLTAGYGAAVGGPKIGPEFTFGIYMQKRVKQPILIIKTAWGGKSLNTDFRPPSAGPYAFNEQQLEQLKEQGKDIEQAKEERAKVTGHYYRLMMTHINKVLGDIKRVYPDYDPQAGYELSGFVWFQGWNDMVDRGTYPNRDRPGGYDQYSDVLAHFVRDVRKDLAVPELPFVIGVLGVGGPVDKYGPDQQRYKGIHSEFRQAMAAPAAMPEFKGNVTAVLTETYWDLHLTELAARWGKVQAKSRSLNQDKTLDGVQRKKLVDAFTSELFTAEELKTFQAGTSNAAYHYMGSAKILAQIGKAFAEALPASCGEKDEHTAGQGLAAPVPAVEDAPRRWSYRPELLRPFWAGNVVEGESVLFIRDADSGEARASVLFPIQEMLAVRNSAGDVTFENGRDFVWKPGSREIVLPAGSRIVSRTPQELRRPAGSQKYALTHRDGNGEILFGGRLEYADMQTCITYRHEPGMWKTPVPKFDPRALPRTLARLTGREPLSIVTLGDSISAGANASALYDAGPFQPAYPALVRRELAERFGGEVQMQNLAVGGTDTGWGLTQIDKVVEAAPHLVILAFGMNDSAGRSTHSYKENTQKMIAAIREKRPECEFILVASMLGNRDWITLKHEVFPQYRNALAELVEPGIALADLTSTWTGFLELKKDWDQTGNGVNHPNDFGHRVYAQVITTLLDPGGTHDADPDAFGRTTPNLR